MVDISFYGGAGEIGGNMILIHDGDARIMLDFGMSLGQRGRFFSEPFLSPRNESGLISLGIIPNVAGLYRGEEGIPVDAVFLSHAHIDHSMSISLLNRNIPLYCGETTKTILEALSSARPGGFENDLDGIQFKTFRTGDRLNVNGIEVEPVHVDHSMPGSYGFIVHTSLGAIAYSGDFRAHGPRADMTQDFADKAEKSSPELFLCEGTNLVRGDLQSEAGVLEKVGHVVRKTKGLVLANFSTADVDRLRTFYDVAKENGRILAVSLRQAYLLQSLLKDKRLMVPDVSHDPNVVVYQRSKKTYYGWEKETMKNGTTKTAKDVKENQGKFVLAASSYDMNEVLDIKPDAGGAFINSSSEPFNEEMEIDHERFVNWLDHFGLPMYQIHSSGHMMPTELRETIAQVSPKTLVPIHTDQPQLYELFVKDLCKVHQPLKGSTWSVE
ncbi:MAG TPA: MBL fold metallo-hydrolase [Candidatus Bathyarchaeia archaeon]|jgi:ribonuclease J|nr:MBL fold metallo-hydrolase [Candidatus Bathyarchaeia archaeon]